MFLIGGEIGAAELEYDAVFAVRECLVGNTVEIVELGRPTTDISQEGNETQAFLGERVFHTRRNFRILLPLNQFMPDQFLQGVGQNCVRDVVEGLFYVVVAYAAFGIEQAQDSRLPAAAEKLQCILQWTAKIFGELRLIHNCFINKQVDSFRFYHRDSWRLGILPRCFRANPRISQNSPFCELIIVFLRSLLFQFVS